MEHLPQIGRLPLTGLKSRTMQKAIILFKFQIAEEWLKMLEKQWENVLMVMALVSITSIIEIFRYQLAKEKQSRVLVGVASGDAATVLKHFARTIDDISDVWKRKIKMFFFTENEMLEIANYYYY